MIICFRLTMPSAGSWNGKWSGAGKLYARVINFGHSKKGEQQARAIADKKVFFYDFGDGWTAKVEASIIDARNATKIRNRSEGFCGYDWMLESIKRDLIIRPTPKV